MTVLGLKHSHSLPRVIYLESNRAGAQCNVPCLQWSLKSVYERRTLQIHDRDFKLDNRRMPHNRGEKRKYTSRLPCHFVTGKKRKWSHVRLFATQWTVAYQAPPSMEYSRQEYWSGLPFPSPGDLPDPGIKPGSPALQADYLPSELKVPSSLIRDQTCALCIASAES